MSRLTKTLLIAALVFIVAGGSVTVLAQTTKSKVKSVKDTPEQVIPPNNARISFDHTLFDFGVVPRGEKVTHHFPVKNTGSDTLTITKIKPGCGCTTTRKKSIVLPPGESAFIDITYRSSKSAKRVGKATKRIRIESTDSSTPTMNISISARTDTADCSLRCNPLMADFNEILIDKKAEMEVDLTNIGTVKAELEIVSEPTDEFVDKYKIKKTKLDPGKDTRIEFELRKDIPPGDFKTALTVQVKDNQESRITIPIQGTVVESLSKDKEPETEQTNSRVKSIKGKTSAQTKTTDSDKSSHTAVGTTVDDSDLK